MRVNRNKSDGMTYNSKDRLFTQIIPSIGLTLVLFVACLLVVNQYISMTTLDPYYRVTSSGLCLVFGFLTACFNTRLAIAGCMFALPLLPTIAPNIQLYIGYGRVLGEQAAGFDLIIGTLLGTFLNLLVRKKQLTASISTPWPAALVLLIITVSASVAITRNLHQSGSAFNAQALIYNLLHLRSLGWHDDYRPLLDWAAYASVVCLMAVFIPALKDFPKRNSLLFWPLIASLIISALVGWRQSATGIGLSFDQRNFRVDQFGFVAQGFQPDMHAFGGLLLIGAVGLLGYLYLSKNIIEKLTIIALVIPLSWIVLFLSKSRASFGFGVLALLAITSIWWFRKYKYLPRILIMLAISIGIFVVSLIIFQNFWTHNLLLLIQKYGIPDFDALNYMLSYRPEVYRAAWYMFMLFPLFGLGQAEFYRQSANFDLTQSFFLSIQQNGENAHNYFLQTLVETGLVGGGAFLILIFYPLIRIRNWRTLVPAGVGLLAMFAGNLFSHSMLVRENLLLAAALLALMYASMLAEQEQHLNSGAKPISMANGSNRLANVLAKWIPSPKNFQLGLLISAILLIGALFTKEMYQSLHSETFQSDLQCSKFRRLDPDGWTSGLYVVAMPKGSQGVRIKLVSTQPDVWLRPLPGTLTLVDHNYATVLKHELLLTTNESQDLELRLPEGVLSGRDFRVELKLDRCFIPRNIGMNGDGRRLGVRIETIQWLK